MFRVIFFTALSVYMGTNVYLAHTLGSWLGLSGIGIGLWYGGYALLAGSFFLSNLSMLPVWLSKGMYVVGGWYMAAYLVLLIVVPLLHLVLRHRNGPLSAVLLLIAMVIYVAAGFINAGQIRTTRYTVQSDKIDGLRIALISDLHIGTLIGADKVEEMVAAVNRIDADYVLMAGDLFDVEGPSAVEGLDAVGKALQGIQSKKGVYAIFGNHDGGFDRQHDYAARLMESWGMTVLRDQVVQLEDITIVGRRDAGEQRLTVGQLLQEVDRSRYLVLLDHQPNQLNEGQAAGVDLMLCGHTHGGQVFPANLVTRRMFRLDHGILQEGGFTAIVSSGAGTWGPRMRTGTVSEVVEIVIE